MSSRLGHLIAMAALIAGVLAHDGRAVADLLVSPTSVLMRSPEATQQLLVTDSQPDGRNIDLSRRVGFEVANPAIAAVDSSGLVRPLAEGRTEILIDDGRRQLRVPLEVAGLSDPVPVLFEHEIVPILSKTGCNSGGCHGKAEGQNGFKLSVFGFDPPADFDALVKQGRGRRVFVAAADQSVLLQKSTALVPHGGGQRIEPDSLRYRRMRRWITEGAQFLNDESRTIQAIEVDPKQQVLLAGGSQQLRVTAIDAAGNRRCVTVEAEYESNASTIVEVDGRGLIQATDIPGEAAVLVRYMGHVAISRITLPRPGIEFQRPPEVNFVDRLVWDKLGRLGIAPSGLADDASFLRRVYIDTIATLPTPEEARRFLASDDPKKRSRLVDRLLGRDEYVDYWTMRWSDILRIDKTKVTPQGAVAMTRWLKRQFRENRPYDEFVREIVTARGNTLAEGPASFYTVLDKPAMLSKSISQLFLGTRIECAQCHHHPFQKWSQDDYYGFAGFFTGVKRKALPTGGQIVFADGGSDMQNPRTGETVPTRALGAEPQDHPAGLDRRAALADWMTAADNPYFAKSIANRLWAHYFGRGLVEPIDDMRETNPPTNEPLLDALAEHLREVDYDLKALTRTLLNSRVYQLSLQTNESNATDAQNFSHATYKALPAEVLLDAISQATGVPEKFDGWPEGYRAIQIWDNYMPSYFFRIFGRPVRVSVCECERSNEPSISQALHLLNSPDILGKIHSPRGRARRLVQSDLSPGEVIDELYLATLSRFPSRQERALMMQAFTDAVGDRTAAVEDVLWAQLNSKEFIYNH